MADLGMMAGVRGNGSPAWADLGAHRRRAWLDPVRDRACGRPHRDRPAAFAEVLDVLADGGTDVTPA
ncbi:hypothetical protein AB0M11_17110 [Streptomyces sp. NPDC051987]|uniref:hypothetical protein n=1 Tax=Streptomyces sp. NPDC051987 TaxID=3155808 RepID=UPI003427FA30